MKYTSFQKLYLKHGDDIKYPQDHTYFFDLIYNAYEYLIDNADLTIPIGDPSHLWKILSQIIKKLNQF